MGTRRKRALPVVAIGLLFAVSQLLTDCRRQDGQRPQVREIGNEAMRDNHIMQRARAMLLTIAQEAGHDQTRP
jgi:hypothetical protein